MPNFDITPCYVFFNMMKKYGGISYKEMASMILSGKPLTDGKSPSSRANDRSWVSRFIVHAPIGSLQDSYFCDFSVSALRIVSKLKAKGRKSLNSAGILDLICGDPGEEMVQALSLCHQDISLYRNMLFRIANESGFTIDERAEIAMVMFVAVACTANVRRAADCALDFSKNVHGAGMTTPMVTPNSMDEAGVGSVLTEQPTIGLLRIVDGYVVGVPHWIKPSPGSTEIGAMALEHDSITDVAVDVSAHHARIFATEDGKWWIEGLNSTNGTKLISGIDHSECIVEAPASEREEGQKRVAVQIHPGDELLLGASTRFAVIEGVAGL